MKHTAETCPLLCSETRELSTCLGREGVQMGSSLHAGHLWSNPRFLPQELYYAASYNFLKPLNVALGHSWSCQLLGSMLLKCEPNVESGEGIPDVLGASMSSSSVRFACCTTGRRGISQEARDASFRTLLSNSSWPFPAV